MGSGSNEAELLPHYQRTPKYYSPLKQFPLARLCDLLGVAVPAEVLDVGCGSGYLADVLPDGVTVTGFDYSGKRVAVARENHPDHYWHTSSWQDWFASEGQAWPMIVAVEVLEHVDDRHGLLAAMRAVGDVVVATVPIRLPYRAHLTDWPSVAAAVADLEPSRFVELKHGQTHAAMVWECLDG